MKEGCIEKVALLRRPPGLSPFLADVLDGVLDSLVKNTTPTIIRNLIQPIKSLSKPGTDLSPLISNASMVAGAAGPLHRGIVRRAALGSLWRRTVDKTLWQCAGVDEKQIDRQRKCPPMGFVGAESSWLFPCRTLYCPHCHCRSALKTLNRLQVPWQDPAIMVLRVEADFKDKIVGFEPDAFSCTKEVRNALARLECVCMRICGAALNDGVPASVESYLAIAPKGKVGAAVRQKLEKVRNSIAAGGRSATLKTPASLEKGVAMAYRCCPFALTALSDVLDDNAMLHSLDAYHDVMAGVRRAHCTVGVRILKPICQVAACEDAATLDQQSFVEKLEP